MYKIQRTSYGYHIIFSGFIDAKELSCWVDESKDLLADSPNAFSVLIDMRELKPLPLEALLYMSNGQKLYKDRGMKRSAVVVSSSITKLQFKRMALDTGIYAWERYLDTQTNPDWESLSMDWLLKGVDPDKK